LVNCKLREGADKGRPNHIVLEGSREKEGYKKRCHAEGGGTAREPRNAIRSKRWGDMGQKDPLREEERVSTLGKPSEWVRADRGQSLKKAGWGGRYGRGVVTGGWLKRGHGKKNTRAGEGSAKDPWGEGFFVSRET